MHIKIKVCGITNYEDAKVCLSLGVDALGFCFSHKDPRFIEPEKAYSIIEKLPPLVTKVGVFNNNSLNTIDSFVKVSGVDTVQLNGTENPEFASMLRIPVIKRFKVTHDFNPAVLDVYAVSALLIDMSGLFSSSPSPRLNSWSIAKTAVRRKKTVILAGQLGLSNMQEALDEVQPYAVDVNSSIEVKPGIKNPQKLSAVVRIVRNWK